MPFTVLSALSETAELRSSSSAYSAADILCNSLILSVGRLSAMPSILGSVVKQVKNHPAVSLPVTLFCEGKTVILLVEDWVTLETLGGRCPDERSPVSKYPSS